MSFCPKCGKRVQAKADFCPSCGNNLKQSTSERPTPSVPLERKNEGIAAILSFILGLAGLMGIGQIYVGRIARGIAVLIVGIVLAILVWGSLILGFFTLGIAWIGTLFFGVVWLVLLVWQTFDAYSLAQKFNREVQETGKTPW